MLPCCRAALDSSWTYLGSLLCMASSKKAGQLVGSLENLAELWRHLDPSGRIQICSCCRKRLVLHTPGVGIVVLDYLFLCWAPCAVDSRWLGIDRNVLQRYLQYTVSYFVLPISAISDLRIACRWPMGGYVLVDGCVPPTCWLEHYHSHRPDFGFLHCPRIMSV